MDKRTTINVHLQPGAKRSEILGFRENALYARVTAVAEKGRANQALLGLMADTLGISRSALSIIRGQTSRNKVIAIQGLSFDELKSILEQDISCQELLHSLKKQRQQVSGQS
jgi:uncharacterized protein (TIGR00251 family)